MQQQVTYVLDYETGIIKSDIMFNRQYHKYHYQVDSRGNVKIQHMMKHETEGNDSWKCITRLSVVDNIPIPAYLINMLKELIKNPTYRSVINVFNDIKSGLKELANNPLNATDIKSQLDFSMSKNEILQKEIEDLKVKNTKITEAYWKSAADVVRISSEKLALELAKPKVMHHYTSEFGPEFEPEFSDTFKTDYTHTPHTPHTPHSLQDCYHNPGGATIYTKANAMNRMVFNPLLGIYEPGDEK